MKRIMFICSAGMSTSLLVTKVETAAKAKGIDVKVWAVSESEAKNFYDDVDVILLGPQVRFLKGKVVSAIAGKDVKVDVVETVSYGRMDGEAVLAQAMKYF